MIEFENLTADDKAGLKQLIENHQEYTNSNRAKEILSKWDKNIGSFVKVFPIEFKKALERLKTEEQPVEALETV